MRTPRAKLIGWGFPVRKSAVGNFQFLPICFISLTRPPNFALRDNSFCHLVAADRKFAKLKDPAKIALKRKIKPRIPSNHSYATLAPLPFLCGSLRWDTPDLFGHGCLAIYTAYRIAINSHFNTFPPSHIRINLLFSLNDNKKIQAWPGIPPYIFLSKGKFRKPGEWTITFFSSARFFTMSLSIWSVIDLIMSIGGAERTLEIIFCLAKSQAVRTIAEILNYLVSSYG